MKMENYVYKFYTVQRKHCVDPLWFKKINDIDLLEDLGKQECNCFCDLAPYTPTYTYHSFIS